MRPLRESRQPSSAPVLTFVNERAATGYECQNRAPANSSFEWSFGFDICLMKPRPDARRQIHSTRQKRTGPRRFATPAQQAAIQLAHLVWSTDAENPQAGRQDRDNALHHRQPSLGHLGIIFDNKA